MSGRFAIINPEELGAPRGWNNGMLAPPGAGALRRGPDGPRRLGAGAGGRVRAPVRPRARQRARRGPRRRAASRATSAGSRSTSPTWSSTAAASSRLGEAYRRRMGTHFPAMALVEVTSLVDPQALVEIEATAVLGQ